MSSGFCCRRHFTSRSCDCRLRTWFFSSLRMHFWCSFMYISAWLCLTACWTERNNKKRSLSNSIYTACLADPITLGNTTFLLFAGNRFKHTYSLQQVAYIWIILGEIQAKIDYLSFPAFHFLFANVIQLEVLWFNWDIHLRKYLYQTSYWLNCKNSNILYANICNQFHFNFNR